MQERDQTLYMMYDTDDYEMREHGPYWGVPGLDFNALTLQYRKAAYAAANAEKMDQCGLTDGDFAAWLLKTGVLKAADCVKVGVSFSNDCENRFVPEHWPTCPECDDGRGELEYGTVRKSLNRIATSRRCTECRHEWDHKEEANNSTMPMLDDDGRDTHGGCVPFAISKACGINFADVLVVCEKHGWTEAGMNQSKAVVAARELGFDLEWLGRHGVGSNTPPTLKRLLGELPANRNYVVGVKDHWLALVRGQIIDNDTNSTPARKVLELYEVKPAQAVAA